MPQTLPPPDESAPPSREVDENNRKAIEAIADAGQTVVLGKGTIGLDRAVWARGNGKPLVIVGQGPDTVLVNRWTAYPYMMNQAVTAHGEGLGYLDPFELPGKAGLILKLTETGAASRYGKGKVAFITGMRAGGRMDCHRRVVVSADPNGNTVVIDEPFAPLDDVTWYAVKATDGEAVEDVPPGSSFVKLTAAAAADFPVGSTVLVTSGPVVGYESPGEFRKVAAFDATAGLVSLDLPLLRGYANAACIRVTPALVRLENLTLAPNPGTYAAEPLCCKFTQLDLRAVKTHGCMITNCGPSTFADCRFTDWSSFGACDRVKCVRGTYGMVSCEEANVGMVFEDLDVGPGYPNGFQTPTGDNERLTVRNCKVRLWPFDWRAMPFAWGGKDLTVERVEILHTPQNSYLSGDRLAVQSFWSSGPAIFLSGRDMYLSDVSTPATYLGWVNDPGSGGQLIGHRGPLHTGYNPSGTNDWRVLEL